MFSTLFFFNDTSTTEIYTLSLHDALPISIEIDGTDRGRIVRLALDAPVWAAPAYGIELQLEVLSAAPIAAPDRKSTRLNSSHANISYAVFCLKKKKTPSHTMLHKPISHSL